MAESSNICHQKKAAPEKLTSAFFQLRHLQLHHLSKQNLADDEGSTKRMKSQAGYLYILESPSRKKMVLKRRRLNAISWTTAETATSNQGEILPGKICSDLGLLLLSEEPHDILNTISIVSEDAGVSLCKN